MDSGLAPRGAPRNDAQAISFPQRDSRASDGTAVFESLPMRGEQEWLPSFPCRFRKPEKGSRTPTGPCPIRTAPPPASSPAPAVSPRGRTEEGAQQRAHAGHARLSAFHCSSRQRDAGPKGSGPGQAFWDVAGAFDPVRPLNRERRSCAVTRALPAPACPSPVAAPHAPIVMPASMMPEPARERSVSLRARAPHPLHLREYLRERRP